MRRSWRGSTSSSALFRTSRSFTGRSGRGRWSSARSWSSACWPSVSTARASGRGSPEWSSDLGAFPDIKELHGALWPRALVFSTIMVLCLLAFGLYSARQRARFAGMVIRVAIALLAGFAVTGTLFYMIPALWIGRGVAGLAALGGLFGVVVSRLVFAHLVDENIFKRRVLVYGAAATAAAIAGLRRRADRRGFFVVGFLPAHRDERAVGIDKIIDTQANLVHLCQRLGVAEVVVAMDDRRRDFPVRELLQCRLAGIEVTEVLT